MKPAITALLISVVFCLPVAQAEECVNRGFKESCINDYNRCNDIGIDVNEPRREIRRGNACEYLNYKCAPHDGTGEVFYGEEAEKRREYIRQFGRAPGEKAYTLDEMLANIENKCLERKARKEARMKEAAMKEAARREANNDYSWVRTLDDCKKFDPHSYEYMDCYQAVPRGGMVETKPLKSP